MNRILPALALASLALAGCRSGTVSDQRQTQDVSSDGRTATQTRTQTRTDAEGNRYRETQTRTREAIDGEGDPKTATPATGPAMQ